MREQLHVFIDDVVDYVHSNIRPLAIIGLGGLPGNGIARVLMRPVITKETNKVKFALQNHFNTILNAAEEVDEKGVENVDFQKYYDRMLNAELLYQNYVGDREEEIKDDLKRRVREGAEDIAPLINTEADDFWEALVEAYELEEAKEVFEYHFRYYERMCEEYDGGEIELTTDTLIPLNYTEEALRLYPQAEAMVRESLHEGYDEEYERQAKLEAEKKEELEQKVNELRQENQQLKRELKETPEEEMSQ